MELHFFIFLATKSGPALFQPFSHPSPQHTAFQGRAPQAGQPGAPRLVLCPLGAPSETRAAQKHETLTAVPGHGKPRAFPLLHCLVTWIPKSTSGQRSGNTGCATSFMTVSHIREFHFVSFVAYGCITRRNKMESKKTWKKEAESFIPLLVAKRVHYKNQD